MPGCVALYVFSLDNRPQFIEACQIISLTDSNSHGTLRCFHLLNSNSHHDQNNHDNKHTPFRHDHASTTRAHNNDSSVDGSTDEVHLILGGDEMIKYETIKIEKSSTSTSIHCQSQWSYLFELPTDIFSINIIPITWTSFYSFLSSKYGKETHEAKLRQLQKEDILENRLKTTSESSTTLRTTSNQMKANGVNNYKEEDFSHCPDRVRSKRIRQHIDAFGYQILASGRDGSLYHCYVTSSNLAGNLHMKKTVVKRLISKDIINKTSCFNDVGGGFKRKANRKPRNKNNKNQSSCFNKNNSETSVFGIGSTKSNTSTSSDSEMIPCFHSRLEPLPAHENLVAIVSESSLTSKDIMFIEVVNIKTMHKIRRIDLTTTSLLFQNPNHHRMDKSNRSSDGNNSSWEGGDVDSSGNSSFRCSPPCIDVKMATVAWLTSSSSSSSSSLRNEDWSFTILSLISGKCLYQKTYVSASSGTTVSNGDSHHHSPSNVLSTKSVACCISYQPTASIDDDDNGDNDGGGGGDRLGSHHWWSKKWLMFHQDDGHGEGAYFTQLQA